MTSRIVLAAAIAAIILPGAAAAQSFEGARVELRGGWDSMKAKVSVTDGVDTDSESGSSSDIGYGAELGYDVSFGQALVGLYGGLDLSEVKECLADGTESLCLSAGRSFTLGARVGVPVGERALIYAKAGYSNGKLSLKYTDTAFPADNASVSGTMDGFHLGAGGEILMGSNTYLKAEYVYTDYGDYDYSEAPYTLTLAPSRHQVRAGVGIRF